MTDIDELINWVISAARGYEGSSGWGVGKPRAARELRKAKAALRAAFSELQERLAALEAVQGEQLERIVRQVENGR